MNRTQPRTHPTGQPQQAEPRAIASPDRALSSLQDPPYLLPSDAEFAIEVSKLGLELPVHEQPGAAGTPPEIQ